MIRELKRQVEVKRGYRERVWEKYQQEKRKERRKRIEKAYLVDTHIELPPSFWVTQDSITLTNLVVTQIGREGGVGEKSVRLLFIR